jgi:hypothetical protein
VCRRFHAHAFVHHNRSCTLWALARLRASVGWQPRPCQRRRKRVRSPRARQRLTCPPYVPSCLKSPPGSCAAWTALQRYPQLTRLCVHSSNPGSPYPEEDAVSRSRARRPCRHNRSDPHSRLCGLNLVVFRAR